MLFLLLKKETKLKCIILNDLTGCETNKMSMNSGLKKNKTLKNRKDRLRYEKRKQFKLKNQKIQSANEMILNKLTITPSDYDECDRN